MDPIADALSFFKLSAGRWRSQRTSHHLLHRKAEAGGSVIEVVMVAANDPRLGAIAQLHGQDPATLAGAARCAGAAPWPGTRRGKITRGKVCSA